MEYLRGQKKGLVLFDIFINGLDDGAKYSKFTDDMKLEECLTHQRAVQTYKGTLASCRGGVTRIS